MAESQIIIHDYHVDQNTGHVSVFVKTHTVEGSASWDGPTRRYGIDAVAFRDRFEGNVQQFENWVASEHRAYEGAHVDLVDHLLQRKGKAIG